MSYIKNREELLAHGEIGLRAQALELIDAGILNADPYQKTKELVQIKDGVLQVGKQRFLCAGRWKGNLSDCKSVG